MTTVMTPDSQHRPIQVYFLAAPEDQDVCEVIHKYLKPVIRSSKVPIEVNSDFNIPSGADTEKYKERLFEADIVLALISADFIANDDTYYRNQKVSERHNNREAVIIPILVRNCLWKSTPFKDMHVLPKNEQPLNNKQFWSSPDDAVTAVVEDIYTSINDLTHAFAQRAAMQPAVTAEVQSAPVPMAPVETPIPQVEPASSMTELPPAQRAAVQPAVESLPDLTPAVETPMPRPEPEVSLTELAPAQRAAVQPAVTAEVESAPVPAAPVETPVSQMEPDHSPTVPPAPAPEIQSAPVLTVPSGASSSQPASQAKASSPIPVDWRKKYYRTVALKRAGAILLDHILLYIALVIVLLPFADSSEEIFNSAMAWAFLVLYFVLMPIMESSKWQGTIGKRILKLQITDKEGDRINFMRAFGRNIMRSVVLYLYVLTFGLLLVVQYFRYNKTRKLFHDELTGTVIGERLSSSAPAKVAVTPA